MADITNDTLLYQLGKFVGGAIRDLQGYKPPIKTVKLDQVNGTETNDGFTEPTSSFIQALVSALQFSPSKIEIQNSFSVVYTASYLIQNQILYFDGSQNGDEPFRIVFSPISDSAPNIIGKLAFNNSFVVFDNIEIAISNELQPEEPKDLLSTPLFTDNSVLVFKNCKFSYDGDSDLIQFIAGRLSSVQLYNCEIVSSGSSIFMFGSNNGIPNLLVKDDLTTITGSVTFMDSDSYWISIFKPNSETGD